MFADESFKIINECKYTQDLLKIPKAKALEEIKKCALEAAKNIITDTTFGLKGK